METNVQAGLPVVITNSYAQVIAEAKLEQEVGNSIVVREPFGVVGAITPWIIRCIRLWPKSLRRWQRAAP